MKILHLNINESLGGAAKAAETLHYTLLKSGIDSRLIVLKKKTNSPSVYSIKDFYSFKNKIILHLRKIIKIFKRGIFGEKVYDNSTYVFDLLNKLDFDILHCHWVTNGFLNLNELKKIKKPIVWTMHDSAAFTGICNVTKGCVNFKDKCGYCPLINSKKLNDKSHKEYLRKTKIYNNTNISFISPSKIHKDIASTSPILSHKQIKVIHHGIDTGLFYPIDKKSAKLCLGLEINKNYILNVSVNLNDENKGLFLLYNALSNLNIDNTELLLIGNNEYNNKELKIPIKNLGFINDEILLRIVYSAADLLVLPSKEESFGLTAAESMACNTPVVAFKSTGIEDIISHRKDGYLASYLSTNEIMDGIIWCLKNREKIGDLPRKKIIEKFQQSKMAEEYKKMYFKLLMQN